MNLRQTVLGCLVAICGSSAALAGYEEELEKRQWQEGEIKLPALPKESDLMPLYVSASTENQFFVDGANLSVGADGVVRYSMVIISPSGARNVTYEGIRCATRDRKIYAAGRSDGTWSKSRNSEWTPILFVHANRQHAALWQDYFCPFGNAVHSPDEARAALKRGGHPERPN